MRFLLAQHRALAAEFPSREGDVDMPMFPVFALNNLDAMTAPERTVSGEGVGGAGISVVCPAARISAEWY